VSDNKKYLKSTLIISLCSFLSQILGLLRTTLLSSFYGATESEGLADCYSAAFKLPDIIFTLVASGIVSIVLIPYFLTKMKEGKADAINKICSGFINIFFLILSFFIIIGMVFAPYIVKNILLSGWTDDIKIALTVKMTRILFLQVLFISLSSIFGSYLNALEKFLAYSLALLSYNVGIIIGILFLAPYIGIEGVVWGVVAGSFIHLAIQAGGSIKNGFKYSLVLPKIDKELIFLTLNGIPRVITLASSQIVRFFYVTIGSFIFTGAIFIFDNVENIAMVPYGLVAISFSTTAFPIFIKYFNKSDYSSLYDSLFEKLRMLFYFILPVTVVLIVLRKEIVDILIGYNKYLPKDVEITKNALFYLALSIPFFSASLLIVKFYYALRFSLIPMFIALFSSVLSIAVSYLLVNKLEVASLSIGRSAGYLTQFILLMIFLIPVFRNKIDPGKNKTKPVIETVVLITISSVILVFGLFLQQWINISNVGKVDSILKILLIGFIISVLYFISTYLTNSAESKMVLNYITSKFKK